MATGCQGPFVNGTGGWCGCNCKCCPPPDMVKCVQACFAPYIAPGFAYIENFNATINGSCNECTSLNLTGITFQKTLEDSKTAYYNSDGPTICGNVTVSYNLTLNKLTGKWEFKIFAPYPTIVATYTMGIANNEYDLNNTNFTLTSSTDFCVFPENIKLNLYNVADLQSQESPIWEQSLSLPIPPQPIPIFNYGTPSSSPDKRFIFGGPESTCSIPCTPFCILLYPTTACGFQISGTTITLVGNGCIDVSLALIDAGYCGNVNIKLNGLTPPACFNDGEEIIITLELTDPSKPCCDCVLISVEPCVTMAVTKPSLFLRKIDSASGKPKINPRTGKPIIVINKKELTKRLIARRQNLRPRKN